MSDVTHELDTLRQENARLRAELNSIRQTEGRGARQRKKALGFGASLLLPAFDRKRVVRSFMQLTETLGGFASPRDGWPTHDKVVDDSRAFAHSVLRFAIRRRALMLILGLTALVIPGIQIWLVYQQNNIIESQNRFFEIQVYDTAARGLTSGTRSSRQVTGALLAKTELGLLQGIVEGVFGEDLGGASAAGFELGVRRMQESAFRGYLLSAVARQIQQRAGAESPAVLDERVHPMFQAVIHDAVWRVPVLLRIPRSAANSDPGLTEEVSFYLLGLVGLMRTHYRLALSVGKEARFFATIAPVIARATRTSLGEKSPFVEVFFERAMLELLVDVAQSTKFGEKVPEIGSDQGAVDRLVRSGFDRLKTGVGTRGRVNWGTFKRLSRVP